jgi:hypothetical protein
MQPIIPVWITEAIIIVGMAVGAAVIVAIMALITLESIIIRSDDRRAKHEKQNQP